MPKPDKAKPETKLVVRPNAARRLAPLLLAPLLLLAALCIPQIQSSEGAQRTYFAIALGFAVVAAACLVIALWRGRTQD
ncbi:hypothetical protein HPO96_28080 [Kribbella sandramycini]|uniref:Uncharacterized protein n=1 Tax=Kribbella sandramycini TaxID=60450 RepID=A0A7Y4L626_9ACTN|nr:hypothetical protein [Kribbella sandramycini]MBB6571461.1 hypothetical protein [Kribbella sandramycini]NOL44112.1 hypothetical protein [Kribbella sandramycini]